MIRRKSQNEIRLSRIIRLYRLLALGWASVDEIVAHAGVSERTLQRDVEALRRAGVKVQRMNRRVRVVGEIFQRT